MITNEDVTKLKEVFATKEELGELKTTVDGLVEKVGDLSVEVGEIHDRLDSLDAKFDAQHDSMHTKLDNIAGMLEDHRLEDAAGAAHLTRHDRQIAALATHARITVPD